ncbi:MAG: CoA-transferase [Pikeienuella sp.]
MSIAGKEELLIHTISNLLKGCGHIAVGVLSPIPGAAALVRAHQDNAQVSIIGCEIPEYRTDGGAELFDQAGQGRIDAFFLSGGQIDGAANINLTGVGDYPQMKARWSGAFGSAYLYFVVPRVILFRFEHNRRIFPQKVDFISSPGISEPGIHRTGGPHALVTNLCVMHFDKKKACFTLTSTHPGVSVEQVQDNTGFDFIIPDHVPETELPNAAALKLIRGPVATAIADPYPKFAAELFGS